METVATSLHNLGKLVRDQYTASLQGLLRAEFRSKDLDVEFTTKQLTECSSVRLFTQGSKNSKDLWLGISLGFNKAWSGGLDCGRGSGPWCIAGPKPVFKFVKIT